MSVADLAAKASTDIPWRTCTVCHHLGNLPKAKANLLVELLSNPLVKYTEISEELASDPEWLLEIDHQTLARHAKSVGVAHRGMPKLRRSK